jgi:hypothetical protein
MGYFDSACAVTGLSLSPLRHVACVPLDGGPVVFGCPNRIGGIDGHEPTTPSALVCGVVYDAMAREGIDISKFELFRAHDGSQHTSGDVMNRYAAAVRRFSGVGWMMAALEEYAVIAERECAERLRHETPARGWLSRAASSWYGAIFGANRRASTTFDGLIADVQFLDSYAFDADTLQRVDHVRALVVQRGDASEIDLTPYLTLSAASGQRARLDDRERANEVFDATLDQDDWPGLVIDREGLRAIVRDLEAPLAQDGQPVWIGTATFVSPPWAGSRETGYGMTRFANVVANGWKEPPPRTR